MQKTSLNGAHQSTESRFSPPAFPPKAGMAGRLVFFSKTFVFDFACIMAFPAMILLSLYLMGVFEYDYNEERSNRSVILEDSTFFLVSENRTEIASADLLPGDWITFTHTGNITEIVHSSTSCSSSLSLSQYGESDQDSYYGGEDDMECWTSYYTHYVLNASSVMFESNSVNEIYMCHRSTCKVTGELVNIDGFLIDIRTVEVIA